MEIASLVFEKLMVLLTLVLTGTYLAKREILTKEVTFYLSKLLTSFVAPSLLLSTFIQAEFTLRRLTLLGLTILAALLIMVVRISYSLIFLKSMPSIDRYGSLFANIGFLGTPLALAVGGEEAVFYIAGFVLINQIFQWSYGLYLITADTSTVNLRSTLVNPTFLTTLLGVLLFSFSIPLPNFFKEAVASFAQLNTPLSTIVLGTYFWGIKVQDIFSYRPAYFTALQRLVVTALLGIGMIWLFGFDDLNVNLALTIAVSTPTAMNTALFSQVYGGDYQHGSRLVLLSTILSIFTVPLIMALASYLYLT